ncbi:hypothetical protein [Burkholderia multivorans]|uniref:hypothetical protein n=1 Tax=Burkholderia multivorans TaxID=87883 RepID=UPI001FC7EF49|nr:hypothetical protein [Burkholderia multivorans]
MNRMKTRRPLPLLLLIAGCWMSMPAFADGTTLGEITQAAQRSGDKSRQALVTIYGNVVNNPLATGGAGGSDTILAGIFQVANGALLVVGALFACYVMFRKVSQTAHDGAVFDREKHTMWGPSCPNLLRRFLEMYLGFRRPTPQPYLAKLDILFDDEVERGAVARYVDEGSHSASTLRLLEFSDFPAMSRGMVERVMRAMERVDPDHYAVLIAETT